MTRWKAFGIHLGISALIGAAAFALIALVWYPAPLLSASGSDRFLAVLIGVDVVVGPALTLLVFKPGKPSLRFDLSVIALLQLGALAYGLGTAINSRPVFLVEAVDRLSLVRANLIDAGDLAEARANGRGFGTLSWTGPVLVGSRMPDDPTARSQLTMDALKGAKPLEERPQYYVPFDEEAEGLKKRGKPLPPLFTRSPSAQAEILAIAQRSGHPVDNLVYVPLETGKRDVAVLLSPVDGRPVGMVDVDPW
jgi:hypothetical protein